jgi:hypothetical protein
LGEGKAGGAAEDHVLEFDPWELNLVWLPKLKLVFDVVWRGEIAA